MYMYVQRPGWKKVSTATYIHTGGVLNAYSHIRTARARVHGWVGMEKQRRRRVHGEPTGWVGTECVVVFIWRAWTEQPMKRGLAYRRTEETALCSTGHGGNRILFIGRGLAYRKTEETDLLRSKRCPVDREGCGVLQNREYGLVLESYG